MKSLIYIAILVLTMSFSCAKDNGCIDESQKNPLGACTMDYTPVCGCDNKTYSNSCVATNAGVISWTEGECK